MAPDLLAHPILFSSSVLRCLLVVLAVCLMEEEVADLAAEEVQSCLEEGEAHAILEEEVVVSMVDQKVVVGLLPF
jgi:hypothetical protein